MVAWHGSFPTYVEPENATLPHASHTLGPVLLAHVPTTLLSSTCEESAYRPPRGRGSCGARCRRVSLSMYIVVAICFDDRVLCLCGMALRAVVGGSASFLLVSFVCPAVLVKRVLFFSRAVLRGPCSLESPPACKK